MNHRRSVRHFAADPVPRKLVEAAIATAGTAPSGAHRQPWCFVAISDPTIKARIRLAAETEERSIYEGGRGSREWLQALAPLGENWQKPYLETAPWLVVVFAQTHAVMSDGRRRQNYHVIESVGVACGLFIAAIHQMGLATLPHSPTPMGFLSELLNRPASEKPYIMFPVGFPAADAEVPDQRRKPLAEVAVWMEGL